MGKYENRGEKSALFLPNKKTLKFEKYRIIKLYITNNYYTGHESALS